MKGKRIYRLIAISAILSLMLSLVAPYISFAYAAEIGLGASAEVSIEEDDSKKNLSEGTDAVSSDMDEESALDEEFADDFGLEDQDDDALASNTDAEEASEEGSEEDTQEGIEDDSEKVNEIDADHAFGTSIENEKIAELNPDSGFVLTYGPSAAKIQQEAADTQDVSDYEIFKSQYDNLGAIAQLTVNVHFGEGRNSFILSTLNALFYGNYHANDYRYDASTNDDIAEFIFSIDSSNSNTVGGICEIVENEINTVLNNDYPSEAIGTIDYADSVHSKYLGVCTDKNVKSETEKQRAILEAKNTNITSADPIDLYVLWADPINEIEIKVGTAITCGDTLTYDDYENPSIVPSMEVVGNNGITLSRCVWNVKDSGTKFVNPDKYNMTGEFKSNSWRQYLADNVKVTLSEDSPEGCAFVKTTTPLNPQEADIGIIVSLTPKHQAEADLDWTVEKQPKCNDTGLRKKICACGNVLIEETMERTKHEPMMEAPTQNPTCTEPGRANYKCKICGENLGDGEIPALGHVESDNWETTVAPTCTEAGTRVNICSRCHKQNPDITESIDALGHDWGDYTEEKAATEDEEGIETRVCSRDSSHKDTRNISKLEPEYTLESGNGQIYRKSGNQDISFDIKRSINADRALSREAGTITISLGNDEKTFTKNTDYTVLSKKGANDKVTGITLNLKHESLEELETGTYELTVSFNDNDKTSSVKASFTIGDAISYDVVDRAARLWTKDVSTGGLIFTFKRSEEDSLTYDNFNGIKVDGAEIKQTDSGITNYTAEVPISSEEGGVKVTLTPEYLSTLTAGTDWDYEEHELTALFDDGNDVPVKFYIRLKPDTKYSLESGDGQIFRNTSDDDAEFTISRDVNPERALERESGTVKLSGENIEEKTLTKETDYVVNAAKDETDKVTGISINIKNDVLKELENGSYKLTFSFNDEGRTTYVPAILVVADPISYHEKDKGKTERNWTKNVSSGGLVFTFERSEEDELTYDEFTGIKVDGEEVPETSNGKTNYEYKKGSVIVTLLPDYLNTLKAGTDGNYVEHELTALFGDGEPISTKFYITSLPEESDNTDDGSEKTTEDTEKTTEDSGSGSDDKTDDSSKDNSSGNNDSSGNSKGGNLSGSTADNSGSGSGSGDGKTTNDNNNIKLAIIILLISLGGIVFTRLEMKLRREN